jgi:hypothetical protein
MLLDDVTVERVAIRGEQTRLQERRGVVDLVLFGLGEKKGAHRQHLRAQRIASMRLRTRSSSSEVFTVTSSGCWCRCNW